MEYTIMNKGRIMAYTMIKVALDKSIRDIRENPGRGIRNLVDLGTHLAGGRLLQDFFRKTQQMLTNENSPYYELAKYIVHNVEHKIIQDFGIHLAYDSLTYGIQKLRRYEKEQGYNIPWVLLYDFREETQNILSIPEISEVLNCGESLGIYCGIFFVNQNETYLKKLIEMLSTHNYSAFFLLVEPEIITAEIASAVLKASNIAVALAIKPGEDNQACLGASQLLLDKKCLYGAYSEYNDGNYKQVLGDSHFQQIRVNHCTFIFLVRQHLNKFLNKEHFTQMMHSVKDANKYPFIIFDFYHDLAYSEERNFPAENYFITIKGDGQIAVNAKNFMPDEINIRTQSLQAIFQKTMPKVQHIQS